MSELVETLTERKKVSQIKDLPHDALKMRDFAKELGTHYASVMYWVTNRKMPHYKLGGRIYISCSEFIKWYKHNRYTLSARGLPSLDTIHKIVDEYEPETTSNGAATMPEPETDSKDAELDLVSYTPDTDGTYHTVTVRLSEETMTMLFKDKASMSSEVTISAIVEKYLKDGFLLNEIETTINTRK